VSDFRRGKRWPARRLGWTRPLSLFCSPFLACFCSLEFYFAISDIWSVFMGAKLIGPTSLLRDVDAQKTKYRNLLLINILEKRFKKPAKKSNTFFFFFFLVLWGLYSGPTH
jgi:hypothetical protein